MSARADSKDDGAGEFKGDADADADAGSSATLPSLAADIAAADGLIASTRAWGAGRRGSLLSAGLLGGAALAPAPAPAPSSAAADDAGRATLEAAAARAGLADAHERRLAAAKRTLQPPSPPPAAPPSDGAGADAGARAPAAAAAADSAAGGEGDAAANAARLRAETLALTAREIYRQRLLALGIGEDEQFEAGEKKEDDYDAAGGCAGESAGARAGAAAAQAAQAAPP
jgi:hypothetical protein